MLPRRHEYGYSRDRAAATLCVLAKDADIRAGLRREALEPLINMFSRTDDRWEMRDAATCLLKLQYTQVGGLAGCVI